MGKNSNELANIRENPFSKILKKISSFFKKNNETSNNQVINNQIKTNKNSVKSNDFKADLSAEYNELQRLNMIREQYEKDEGYIKHISTEDLIKLTEMNNRETQEIENQIKKEKATA